MRLQAEQCPRLRREAHSPTLSRSVTVDHKRYLIIGASGSVGAHLHRTLQPHAVATYCARPVSGGVYFDSTRTRLADAMPGIDRCYTHAFLLQGVTNIDAC